MDVYAKQTAVSLAELFRVVSIFSSGCDHSNLAESKHLSGSINLKPFEIIDVLKVAHYYAKNFRSQCRKYAQLDVQLDFVPLLKSAVSAYKYCEGYGSMSCLLLPRSCVDSRKI